MLYLDRSNEKYDQLNFVKSDFHNLVFNNSNLISKIIYSTLNSKKYFVATKDFKLFPKLDTTKHFYFDDEIIFINISLKNKFKNTVKSSDISDLMKLRSYLENVI